MGQVLKPLIKWGTNTEVAQLWSARDEAAVATADNALAAAGLTIDAVMARTLSARIGDIERIERMMMAAEARRDAILRELDMRRGAPDRKLPRALHQAAEAPMQV